MEIPGFSTSHIEGPSSVPPSQPHALNEDDWFQIEEDGHAGDVGGQWSTEFFSQFDGSSRFPQQDDMEVDAQSLPYQIPGSTLNIQAAPSFGAFDARSQDITPLPSTPFQPNETSLIGGSRPPPLSLKASPDASSRAKSTASDIPLAALTPPGAVEVNKSPIVVSPQVVSIPRRYRVSQQKMPTELPSHSSSSIERAPKTVSEPVVEVVDWRTIQQELRPESLKADKPIKLFSNLRYRVVAGKQLEPKFIPTPIQLTDIMLALKEYASDGYLRRMADDERYTYIFSEWINKAERDLGRWAAAVPHIFDVLARTDIPMNYLREMKIGSSAKQVHNAAETARSPPQNLEQIQASYKRLHKWIKNTLIPNNRQHLSKVERPTIERPSSAVNSTEEARPVKKPKLEEAIASAAASSRLNVPAPASKPVPKISAPAADMSFFNKSSAGPSVIKPKARLPEISKREPASSTISTTKPTGSAVYVDPVASALQSLRQGQSKSTASVPPTNPPPTLTIRPTIRKPNRKGHLVRFRDDVSNAGVLVSIRHFTQEAHELEPAPWSNIDGVGNGNDNLAEGQALRIHGEMEEEVSWYEPSEFVGSRDVLPATPETLAQEMRERGLLASSESLDTPSENTVDVVSTGPRTGTWKSFMSIPPVTPIDSSQVSALINRLNIPAPIHQQLAPQYSASQWGQTTPAAQQYYGQQWPGDGHYDGQRGYYDYGQNQYSQQNNSYTGHGYQYTQPRDSYYR